MAASNLSVLTVETWTMMTLGVTLGTHTFDICRESEEGSASINCRVDN